VPGAFSLG